MIVMKNFWQQLDAHPHEKTCTICSECYLGMHLHQTSCTIICKRCINEKGIHRFLVLNNMDPREQPSVLKRLSHIEEMLIARVDPILQVSHAFRGQ